MNWHNFAWHDDEKVEIHNTEFEKDAEFIERGAQ